MTIEAAYRRMGKRLRLLRQERRITQDELGRRLGLTRTSIVNMEKGRQRIPLHHVVRACKILRVSIADLLP